MESFYDVAFYLFIFHRLQRRTVAEEPGSKGACAPGPPEQCSSSWFVPQPRTKNTLALSRDADSQRYTRSAILCPIFKILAPPLGEDKGTCQVVSHFEAEQGIFLHAQSGPGHLFAAASSISNFNGEKILPFVSLILLIFLLFCSWRRFHF